MFGLESKRSGPARPPSNPQVETQLAETRAALAAQQARLEEERAAFQAAQQETLRQFAALAAAAANRPNASPQGLASTEAPQISSDASDDEENLDALRRGRRGLRIDLQALTPGGAGAGLNVPRG